MVPSWAGGESGALHVRLGRDFQVDERVAVGQSLIVSVPKPRSADYQLAGASFDPTMLRLDSVLDDPDEQDVVVYGFVVLESGMTILTINSRKGDAGEPEAYKSVELRIEK